MNKALTCLDGDVLQDLGVNPNWAAPYATCGKCGIDITDFTNEEIAAHSRFHRYLAEEPKNIAHQDPRPKLDHFPRCDSAGWLWR